jgi:hypothetical protein
VSASTRGLFPDFYDSLDVALRGGLLAEPLPSVESHALGAIATAGRRIGAARKGPELNAWARRMLLELEAALRMELCRPNGAGLKAEYEDVLTRALTRDGIADLAAVVLRVARAVAPALAVSTVALYVAVWLLKAGLNRWCAIPAAPRRGNGAKTPPRSGTPSRRGKRGRRAA